MFFSNISGQAKLPAIVESSSNIVEDELIKLNVMCENALSVEDFNRLDSLAHSLLAKSEQLKFSNYKGQAHRYLGQAFSFKNNFDSALFHYLMSEKTFYFTEDYHNLAKTEIELGGFLNSFFLYDEAYNSLRIADSLYLVFDFKINEVKLYQNLAEAKYQTEKFNQAIYYFWIYRKFAIMYQSWKDQINADKKLANSYRKLDDFQNAIQYDLDLVIIATQMKDKNIDLIYKELALDYLMAADTISAITTLNNLITISKKPFIVRESHFLLGRIFKEKNDLERSITHYKKSIDTDSNSNQNILIYKELIRLGILTKNVELTDNYSSLIDQRFDNDRIACASLGADYYTLMAKHSKKQRRYKTARQYKNKLKELETNSNQISPEFETKPTKDFKPNYEKIRKVVYDI
jgi:hypothetical protein